MTPVINLTGGRFPIMVDVAFDITFGAYVVGKLDSLTVCESFEIFVKSCDVIALNPVSGIQAFRFAASHDNSFNVSIVSDEAEM